MTDEEFERVQQAGQELIKIVNSIYRFKKLAENSVRACACACASVYALFVDDTKDKFEKDPQLVH